MRRGAVVRPASSLDESGRAAGALHRVRSGLYDELPGQRIIGLADGRLRASLVSRGRSDAPLRTPDNAMDDAIDQAVLGGLRTITR